MTQMTKKEREALVREYTDIARKSQDSTDAMFIEGIGSMILKEEGLYAEADCLKNLAWRMVKVRGTDAELRKSDIELANSTAELLESLASRTQEVQQMIYDNPFEEFELRQQLDELDELYQNHFEHYTRFVDGARTSARNIKNLGKQ